MCPLLLLLVAALDPEYTAALPDNTVGQKFFVVFPENIAYYHPFPSQNKILITSLYDGTVVAIQQYTYDYREVQMNGGESQEFILDARLELATMNITNGSTLQITSNNNITVHAVSYRNNSVQSALVIPAAKLATRYLIPPMPDIPGTTDVDVTTDVTEKAPFKLIVVNTDKPNTVNVQGRTTTSVNLLPNHTALFWLQQQDAFQAVTASQPVAALFGHTCAMRVNCTCGLLYTPLPPAQDGSLNYIIPPGLASIDGATSLLRSDQTSTAPFNPSSPRVQSNSAVILYRPGLLLSLVEENDFASCFVVSAVSELQTFAVIMVNKDGVDEVYVGTSSLQSPQWESVAGTDYVSTRLDISSINNIIWHKSSKMAVYFGGRKGSALFGNPAPIISNSPDFRGCVLIPEVLHVGPAPMGWRESVQYCQNRSLELISISTADFQTQIYQKLIQARVQPAWIGLRRSSQTGQWYWLNGDPVVDTNWDQGEPGAVDEGQCGVMKLKDDQDFVWSDEDCCESAFPLCYKEPVLLNL